MATDNNPYSSTSAPGDNNVNDELHIASLGFDALSRPTLDLSEKGFGDTDIGYFQTRICTFVRLQNVFPINLTTLDLSGNNIGSEGAFQIFGRILHKVPKLATVNLSGNKIGDKGAEWISRYTNRNCGLTSINLENNNITTIGSCLIAGALRKNECTLTLNQ